ncbi:MAG: hypothetical protein JO247_02875 [Chloroflexi bacterium]|nr:hypothetical protein [Chloroflexota bacterium]
MDVLDVDADGFDPGDTKCEVLVDWNVALDKAQAFEDSRKELFELRKRLQPGFMSNRLRVSAGIRNKFLIIQIFRDVESAMRQSREAVEELRAFGRSHSYADYGAPSPAAEAHYVVHRI